MFPDSFNITIIPFILLNFSFIFWVFPINLVLLDTSPFIMSLMLQKKGTMEMEREPVNTATVTSQTTEDNNQNNGNSHPVGVRNLNHSQSDHPGSCCKLSPWVKKKLLQTFTLCATIWMFGQSQIYFVVIYL